MHTVITHPSRQTLKLHLLTVNTHHYGNLQFLHHALELDKIAVTQLTRLLPQEHKKPLESPPSLLAVHKKVHVCMCVCVQSVMWLHAPMDEWFDSLSVNLTTRVRIPLNVLFLFVCSFFFFLSLFIGLCAAELATWGVSPDVTK